MRKSFALAVLLLAATGFAHAQTKEETMEYLVRELQAVESETFLVKEVAFSENGSVLTFKTSIPGNRDRTLVIQLKNVNIFTKSITDHKDNKDIKLNRDLEYCNLMVESRGRKPGFTINGSAVPMPKKILENFLNDKKLRAMERAFNHLIALVSGRKAMFGDA